MDGFVLAHTWMVWGAGTHFYIFLFVPGNKMNYMQGLEQKYADLQQAYKRRGSHLAALGQNANAGDVIKDFYIYEEDFTDLTAGTSQTGNINIQADSDFLVQKLTYFADLSLGSAITDSTRPIPLATVLITDSGSGRNLSETAVPISNIFGTGQIPFILPQPKLFLARSTITVAVSNFSSGTTYDIRLSFIGYKIFRFGA